jgi:hypothetical protein
MPYWDRDYGDRQRAGGDHGHHRAGGILAFRRGRMAHDQHRMTGQGSRQGGERGRGGGDNRGRGSTARGGSRGGRR